MLALPAHFRTYEEAMKERPPRFIMWFVFAQFGFVLSITGHQIMMCNLIRELILRGYTKEKAKEIAETWFETFNYI